MSIRFNEKTRVFQLDTDRTTYQMKISDIGVLLHAYYGEKIDDQDMSYLIGDADRGFSGNPYEKRDEKSCSLDLLPQEYTSSNVGDYRISSILAVAENGSRSVDLRYVSHEIIRGKFTVPDMPYVRGEASEADSLAVTLCDRVTGTTVVLMYSVFEKKDVITRSAKIINTGEGELVINKAASMSIDLMYLNADLIHFHGRHCEERQAERIPVTHSIHTVSSKRGMSSHNHNPFIILCDHNATQNNGSCYGFMLVYSGNFKAEVEMDQAGSIRTVLGINEENFSWRLEKGAAFNTPEVIMSYTSSGLNALSQNYHRLIRENVCNRKYLDMKRPVLINNWEATYFDFDSEKILTLARQAKELGIEMLVLDDGWFGERNNDDAGLGDWFPNEKKIDGGISRLSKEVTELGLKFGLWIEPEMVNENSDLFRAHPDWVLCDPDRKPTMSRNQMLLDMANSRVRDYLYKCISNLLDTSNISYLKWDYNRSAANVYSNALPKDRQGEAAHRVMLGTYDLLNRITTAYPDVMIEGCAGGGGRFDAGMLFYSPQIWCSDDTDPIERLKIQKGTSYGYPISAMGSHVSASPNHQSGRSTPINTRAVTAMSGTFGYELDLGKVSDDEKEEIKEQIKDFRKYYDIIQKGTYYRLDDNRRYDFYEAWEFVSEDRKEVLFNLVMKETHGNSEHPWVSLLGLDPNKQYLLEKTGRTYSGAALMNGGLTLSQLTGNYPAVQLYFKEVQY